MLIDSDEILPLVRRRMREIDAQRKIRAVHTLMKRDFIRSVLYFIAIIGIFFLGIHFIPPVEGGIETRKWGVERNFQNKNHEFRK